METQGWRKVDCRLDESEPANRPARSVPACWSGLRNTVAVWPNGIEKRSFWVLASFRLSHRLGACSFAKASPIPKNPRSKRLQYFLKRSNHDPFGLLPLKHLSLFPGAPATTILGYGTTSLMGLAATSDRLAVLECAFESGIRHFDTAPYYGYGEAERVLGDFIHGRRDRVTITTKYGIQAPKMIKARWVNLTARRILRLLPFLRKGLSRKAQALTKKCAFTAAEARQSLERSLVALKTDHVDLFLLHEPTYADAASDELHQFLEEEVRHGKIRAFGCGGDFGVIESVAKAKLPTSRWLQFEDNALRGRIEGIRATGAQCITFGLFKPALATLTQWLGSVPGRYDEWERQLGTDCRSEAALAALVQASSHAQNPDGIVLFSTRRADRIASAVKAASGKQFSQEQLSKFNELARDVRLA
jgi:D-threo-aldose 1-dehydrogenase